jgi:transcriptional regulator with XRE-family HTH domain
MGQAIVNNIHRLIAERGWTIYRLSKVSGVSLTALYSLGSKKQGPNADTLVKLADALGVTIDELVRSDGSGKADPDAEELFPAATPEEIARTKKLLEQYAEMKSRLAYFAQNPPESEQQAQQQRKWTAVSQQLEGAVSQIRERDVREVVEYRFIKGNSRGATILRFSGWNCSDKTIDRKISEGIEAVANALKYLA